MSKPTTKTTSGRITTRAEEVYMKKKYPTFEQVTAGRLAVGMKVLIREGDQDMPSSQDGPLVMTAGTYHAICQGEHEWAKTHWEFFNCQPQLPDEPVWLLDMPHPDDEDDEDAVADALAVL